MSVGTDKPDDEQPGQTGQARQVDPRSETGQPPLPTAPAPAGAAGATDTAGARDREREPAQGEGEEQMGQGEQTEREERERLETAFLALLSHELRSPLAAIKGYAATLRRHSHRLGRAERDEFLQAIDVASDRLELIIARLLLLARLEAGTLHPTLVPVDVLHLIQEALAAADARTRAATSTLRVATTTTTGDGRDPRAGQRNRRDSEDDGENGEDEGRTGNGGNGGEYHFVPPDPASLALPPPYSTLPPVLADLRLVRDVLDIVLENAVTYMPGGGVIRVSLHLAPDGRTLTLGVHDQGIGIAPQHLRHIFDRFQQGDTRLTRETGGAGLGLAIAQRLMALQGGTIWATSANVPGEGSNFYLSLPVVPMESSGTSGTPTSSATDSREPPGAYPGDSSEAGNAGKTQRRETEPAASGHGGWPGGRVDAD